MTHAEYTAASTDPDRTTAPDRHDPESDRTDTSPVADRGIGSADDRRESPPRLPPVGRRDRDPRTFPTDGYDGRAYRARAEPMTVWPLRDGGYLVDTDGGNYVVDAARAVCDCPDSALRGARCKHVRRVALEIAAGLVPAPDRDERACAVCGGAAFVDRDARGPALCARHDHDPGTVVADRETGTLLVVVATTGRRTDEVRTDEGRLVADYDTNAAYGRHEPTFAARYVDAFPIPETGDRSAVDVTGAQYLFPASRLRSIDASPAEGDRPAGPTRDQRTSPAQAR